MLNKIVKINNIVSFAFLHYTDDIFIYLIGVVSIAFTAQVHFYLFHLTKFDTGAIKIGGLIEQLIIKKKYID